MKYGTVYVLEDPRKSIPKERDRYVGRTMKRTRARLLEHMAEARAGRLNHRLNWIRSLVKAGVEPTLRVLEELPSDELSEAEIKWIAKFRKEGYKLTNGTDGGEGISGWKHSEETKRKMSEKQKGRPVSQVTRLRRRQSMLGVKHSDEAKERHSRATRGKNNPMYGRTGELSSMYGKPRSQEIKEKISKANKGKPGLSGKDNPMYGKCGELSPTYGRQLTNEQKQHLREINLGKTNSPEARKKISDRLKGRVCSEEHKRKVSESKKRWWAERKKL